MVSGKIIQVTASLHFGVVSEPTIMNMVNHVVVDA